jgi:hypothetical protein
VVAVERGHVNFGPERGLGKGNRNGAVQIGALAREKRMLFDMKHDVEIAGRSAERASLAKTGEADASAVFDASRNFGVDAALLQDAAVAFALGTGIGNDASHALTSRTGARHTEETLLIADLAPSTAGTARDGRFAGSRAGALAFLAAFVAAHRYLCGFAKNCFFEFQSNIFAQISAALGAAAAAGGPSEQIAEAKEVTKDVAQILKCGRIETRGGCAAHAGMAEAIISCALFGIGENGVSLAAFFEFFFCVGIVGIAVGVVLQRQLAIGALDFLVARAAGNPENFVVVAFYVAGQNCFFLPFSASDCGPL